MTRRLLSRYEIPTRTVSYHAQSGPGRRDELLGQQGDNLAAMIAMHLTGTFHPPAGIDPLVIVVNDLSWSFLIAPVGAGAILLALFAYGWHNVVARGPNKGDIWPTRWW